MINSIKTDLFLPSSVVLEMTYSCNNYCIFCSCPWECDKSNYKKGNELSAQEWMSCIDNLLVNGVTNITYSGGEPFLNKNIREIISYVNFQKAKQINSNLEVVDVTPTQYLISNGQLLDGSILDFLKAENVNLSLSLPGLRTYYEHTCNGSPEKILGLFQMAKERGIRTTVNITVTKKNLFELSDTIANALIAGAETLLLNRFLPGGRGVSYTDELMLDSFETIEMITIAEDVLKKANRFGNVGTELPLCIIEGLNISNLKIGTRCSAGISFFVIGPEGMIRTCNHSPVQLCSYENITELRKNNYWNTFCQKSYLPPSCIGCKLSSKCDGGCREAAHIYSGIINGDDPVFKTM